MLHRLRERLGAVPPLFQQRIGEVRPITLTLPPQKKLSLSDTLPSSSAIESVIILKVDPGS